MALKITRRLVLVNLLVLALLLVIIEMGCRFVLHKVYNRAFDSTLLVDNKYGPTMGMRPNATGKVWGSLLHTDNYGWRKNKVVTSGKKKKWLFIGDSVTEGVGVEDSSTFVSRFSEELRDYDVLNCSLIGYSTRDYKQVLADFFARQDTSVQLVTVCYCLNDVYGATPAGELPVMAKQNLIVRMSSWLQENYGTYRLLKLLVFNNSNRYYQYDASFYRADNPHFNQSMEYLRQCDSLCKAHQVFMNVVIIPYRSQVTGKDSMTPQEQIIAFCAAKDIAVSDATGYFRKCEEPAALYLFADEIHLSAKGHQRMLEFLSH